VRPKITVLGDEDCAQRLRDADLAAVVTDLGDVSGADVVVLYTGDDHVYEEIRDRAPNAVVVVAKGSPQPACEATLFPRSRIVGLADQDADVVDVVESILLDRGRVFTAIARCEGERGIESEFAAVPVKLGARGIQEIVES
jgi:malate/lactate dehydrogenase